MHDTCCSCFHTRSSWINRVTLVTKIKLWYLLGYQITPESPKCPHGMPPCVSKPDSIFSVYHSSPSSHVRSPPIGWQATGLDARTNVDLSSVRYSDIHLREISQNISQPSITKTDFRVTNLIQNSQGPLSSLTFHWSGTQPNKIIDH